MKSKRRILALVLTVAMVISLIPGQVLAGDADPAEQPTQTVEETVQTPAETTEKQDAEAPAEETAAELPADETPAEEPVKEEPAEDPRRAAGSTG